MGIYENVMKFCKSINSFVISFKSHDYAIPHEFCSSDPDFAVNSGALYAYDTIKSLRDFCYNYATKPSNETVSTIMSDFKNLQEISIGDITALEAFKEFIQNGNFSTSDKKVYSHFLEKKLPQDFVNLIYAVHPDLNPSAGIDFMQPGIVFSAALLKNILEKYASKHMLPNNANKLSHLAQFGMLCYFQNLLPATMLSLASIAQDKAGEYKSKLNYTLVGLSLCTILYTYYNQPEQVMTEATNALSLGALVLGKKAGKGLFNLYQNRSRAEHGFHLPEFLSNREPEAQRPKAKKT